MQVLPWSYKLNNHYFIQWPTSNSMPDTWIYPQDYEMHSSLEWTRINWKPICKNYRWPVLYSYSFFPVSTGLVKRSKVPMTNTLYLTNTCISHLLVFPWDKVTAMLCLVLVFAYSFPNNRWPQVWSIACNCIYHLYFNKWQRPCILA